MLLSIYQQNSQRSTESLTTHALAVKTSYHLGIHATFLYEFVSVREKEVRARLWFAVVNQDRMLSSALGQPCLIPLQHVRDDIGDFLDATGQNRTVEMSYSRENLTYFRNITWVPLILPWMNCFGADQTPVHYMKSWVSPWIPFTTQI